MADRTSQVWKTWAQSGIETLLELALCLIADFLAPEEILQLAQTCRCLYYLLPHIIVIVSYPADPFTTGGHFILGGDGRLDGSGHKTVMVTYGKRFHIYGPHGGTWAPEPYFNGPVLPARVKNLRLSVKWKDQGWGNKKAEIFVSLVRGWSGQIVAERR